MMAEVIDRSFWNVEYQDSLVSGLWTNCLHRDFEQMSVDYHNAGTCVISHVLQNDDCNAMCDFVFPAGVYMLRHAVELALKTIVCSNSNNPEICNCFQHDKHDILKLFNRCKPILKSSLDSPAFGWLDGFVCSAECLDPSADLFRYPLSLGSGRKSNDEFIDIYKTMKTLTSAYEIVSLAFEKGNRTVFAYGADADYFSAAGSGIGNCMLRRSTTSVKYYSTAEGFADAAKILYGDPSMSWREKCFPLLFLLRHAIELELKHLTCGRNTIGANGGCGHGFKKLWKIPEETLRQRAIDSSWDLSLLNIVDRQLIELGNLDKSGFLFRYPVNKSLEYKLPSSSTLDVKSIYEYQMGIIDFLDGCNGVIDEMADYENDMAWEYGA